jgi:hypothetical protein
MLTSVLLGFSFLPRAKAVMQVFSISPATGNVGANVTLTANLTTTNGGYNVTFDGAVQVVGNATGNNVTASFLVPEATLGNHTVAVVDVSNPLENVTHVFYVSTAYYMNVTVPPHPTQLQEGDSIPISFNVTGGDSNTTYGATINVQNPDNSTYNEKSAISTSARGSANVTLTYPGDFSTGANTHYVGNYTVSANLTVASSAFVVGLTNSTEYHRMQTVNIKAVYASNETVTLNVSGNNVQYSTNLTADSAGVINYSSFAVPLNASVGTYGVNIVSVAASPTVKTVPDTQNFAVPGFAFNLTAENLAGDLVPNVAVSAFENGTSVNNQTTGSNGLAVLMLEIGNYTLKGYFQGVEVGEGHFGVNNTEASDLVLNLTDLNVRVVAIVNGAEVGIPEVGVYLTPENVTLTTNITGNVVAQSLLPNSTYTLNASRYNTPFNVTTIIESSSNNTVNGTITSLLVGGSLVPVFNVTISCPSYTLQVQAFKADGQPFSNAAVEARELVGGINYAGNTDSNGTVAFHNATLGEYDVKILDSAGKELNSTTVNLFQDQNVTVNCNLFGLNISVTVTDYFGQPFANTNVTLLENGVEPISSRTQANGTVTFANLVGDSYSISVYLSDKGPPTMIENLLVDGSTTVSIKMNRYVLLAGLPVETSQLAIVVIIVLSVLLVLLLEVYRRRRNKSQKTDG